jgi:hypothetical protein
MAGQDEIGKVRSDLKTVKVFPYLLPVLGITTNLKLPKQQDWCDKPLKWLVKNVPARAFPQNISAKADYSE